jgi:hypothetical protein
MRHVHLYIVKLFGCMIAEGNVSSIDITTFAHAIMNDRTHPDVYVAFGAAPPETEKVVAGASDLDIVVDNASGQCVYGTWIHHVGNLWVRIVFAMDGQRRRVLADAWHPRLGHKKLEMVKF